MKLPRPTSSLTLLLLRGQWVLARDEVVRLARAAHIAWVAGFSVLAGLLGVLGLGAVSQGRELLSSVAAELVRPDGPSAGPLHFGAFLVAALVWSTTLYAGTWAALVAAPPGDTESMRLRAAAPLTVSVAALAALPVCLLLATTRPIDASLGALAELAGLQVALGWSRPVPRVRWIYRLTLVAILLAALAAPPDPERWSASRIAAFAVGALAGVWPAGDERDRGRRWTWRLLNLGVIAAVATDVAGFPHAFAPAAGLALTCAVGTFFLFRAHAVSVAAPPTTGLRTRLSRPVWWMLGVGTLLSAGIFVWTLFDPLGVGAWIGTAAIGFCAFSAWGLGASIVLVWLPYRVGLPPAAAILAALVLLVATGQRIETHRLRVTTSPVPDRATLTEAFAEWLPGTDPMLPIFLVATSGGGQRAAWWTALSLAALDAQTCGGFSRNTFVVSGTSGGSLGAALHVANVPAPVDSKDCTPEIRDHLARRLRDPANPLSAFLGSDFLSPVFAAAFFTDAVQLFVPYPFIRHDRAYALEAGWEAAWRRSFGTDRFAQPMSVLYAEGERRPQLVLNTTVVETGGRGAFSSMALSLPGVLDLYGIAGLMEPPLSVAISSTARFPYMSPAASVSAGSGPVVARLVDGGYFDNSGADTLGSIVDALPESERGRLALVLISSDPNIGPLCSSGLLGELGSGTPRAFPELLAPIETATRVGIAQAAQSRRSAIARMDGVCERVIELAMGDPAMSPDGTPGASQLVPPLGWYMGRASGEQLLERALLRMAPGRAGMSLLEPKDPCPYPNGAP